MNTNKSIFQQLCHAHSTFELDACEHAKAKEAIRNAIEAALVKRLTSQPINVKRADGSPTRDALREQAAFIAGAATALHAVFGEGDTLTDYVPPSWIIEPMRGNLI